MGVATTGFQTSHQAPHVCSKKLGSKKVTCLVDIMSLARNALHLLSGVLFFFRGVRSQIGISGRERSMGRASASQLVPGLVQEVQVQPQELQVPPKTEVRNPIIKNNLNWDQNRRFDVKINPEACQDRSGACRTSPTTQKSKKVWPSRLRKKLGSKKLPCLVEML